MQTKKSQPSARKQRHNRVRGRVYGTALRPRLSVHRSNTRVRVQLIDDDKGVTIAGITMAAPSDAGTAIAEAAKLKGIKRVVFDRGGYRYHGKVKAVAEGARVGGLQF